MTPICLSLSENTHLRKKISYSVCISLNAPPKNMNITYTVYINILKKKYDPDRHSTIWRGKTQFIFAVTNTLQILIRKKENSLAQMETYYQMVIDEDVGWCNSINSLFKVIKRSKIILTSDWWTWKIMGRHCVSADVKLAEPDSDRIPSHDQPIEFHWQFHCFKVSSTYDL